MGLRWESRTKREPGGWIGQGSLDGKISFFRHHLALGRMGRYGRPMCLSSACVAAEPMHLNTSCFASSLVLQPLPFTSSRLSVLKKDSASASSHRLPGRDVDWAIPWGSRQRWNAREACRGPRSSWKTRLKPSGGLSPQTACSSASATGFSVMRPDIDQPTTFLWNASITAARQGHPWPVPM